MLTTSRKKSVTGALAALAVAVLLLTGCPDGGTGGGGYAPAPNETVNTSLS